MCREAMSIGEGGHVALTPALSQGERRGKRGHGRPRTVGRGARMWGVGNGCGRQRRKEGEGGRRDPRIRRQGGRRKMGEGEGAHLRRGGGEKR